MAQHQRDPVIATGDLDLGNDGAGLELPEQHRQRRQLPVDAGIEHLAMFDLGDEMAVALTKAEHQRAALVDEAGTQPRPPPVAECRTAERRQPLLWRQTAEMVQLLCQHLLFPADLRRWINVLQTASAAAQCVRAGWLTPLRRRLDDGLGHGLVIAGMAGHDARLHPLARQAVVDEQQLAMAAGDATPLVAQRFDRQFEQFGRGPGVGTAGHAVCGRVVAEVSVWSRIPAAVSRTDRSTGSGRPGHR